MLIDSHCHLDQLDLTNHQGRLDLAIAAAKEQGVEYILNVCIDLEHFPKVLAIAKTYAHIFATVGLHPNEKVNQEPTITQLVQWGQDEKIIGIGETGLDYYRSEGELDWQRERFRNHLRAAKQLKKPVIVHSRQAAVDTLRILKEEKAYETGGIMHCFTEDWETAKQAMELNFYISFSGIVTFRNAVSLKEVARQVPLDRMLIETDAPYLAPLPYRGKPNEPAYVRYVAEHIAELKNISLDQVGEATSNNFFKLFNINE